MKKLTLDPSAGPLTSGRRFTAPAVSVSPLSRLRAEAMRLASLFVVALLVFGTHSARAIEGTWSFAVQVSATVSESPPQITLSWPTDTTTNYTSPTPSGFTIYRKTPSATSWGSAIATLSGSATSYPDTSVAVGTVYEYKIEKAYSGYTGHGYIRAAIKAPLVDARGKVVLIKGLTTTQRTSLATEIARLEADLVGDGWTVIAHDVLPTDSVASVKSLITTAYNADPTNVKAVFLFGRVPVPYSGQLNPDGHPDHMGAWPADVYYGDVDGSWPDSSVNYTQTQNTDSADAARLTNTPSDGKFDPSTIPSTVELEVGRVDLANLPGNFPWDSPPGPAFPSETELLRRYLNKDHNFRHRVTNVQRRAIIGDYFGVASNHAFAASGYRSFAPLVGASNIRNLNDEYNSAYGVWLPAVTNNDYLLSYACGAGSYWGIAGAGSSSNTTLEQDEVVFNNVRVVFSFMFGSWFGDWDNINTSGFANNLLRSILATETYGLVSVWSGRPHWFLHPMGLGETVGSCARLTQNNSGLYAVQVNQSANQVHVALMGDPTLRLHPVIPAASVAVSASGADANVTWNASTDTNLQGYHVYRAATAAGPFTRLTTTPVSGTSYTHASAPSGTATYMVRAVKLESSGSGSYYNASQGATWTGNVATSGGGAPNAPSGLSASAVSASQINLSWTDNSNNETGFVIQRSTDNVTFSSIHTTGANATSYSNNSGLSAATTYYYRVYATNGSGDSGNSNVANATTQSNPSGWQTADVGAVSATGSYSESGGTFTVTGSGADIWGTADEFRYVYRQETGNGTIIARVTAVQNTDAWAKAGIMIRDSLNTGAPNAMMLVGHANNSGLTYRTTSNGTSTMVGGAWSWLPTWIKLERNGNTFTGYQSQDGSTWSLVGSITISMGSTVYVGLAVTSHNDGTLCTSTLDNVSVNFTPTSSWTNTDVGAVGAAGSYSESSGVFTVNGSGADIWDTADEFQFVYKQKSGNGTIIARVTAVQNTNAWAKAGIMIRDSLSAGAPNAMMLVGHANNSGLTYRTTSSGTSTMVGGAWSWLPTWIKLERNGNTFTGYQSQDGTTWSLVGSVTISMASNAYIGLAVTSHNDGTVCTATLDNVSLTWP